ncbi:uncharacterized protein LOC125014770, partial [Mugil cephalus]|uniref:uncharacterized protein LOC125014770 n=1 Tax=Mugil cephalus TaxID=48193 RepID=UPI001FB7D0CD
TNWPQIFRGETITLTCEIQGGGPSCAVPKPDSDAAAQDALYGPSHTFLCVLLLTLLDTLLYCGHAQDKPRATLTSGPTTIPVGGRVTLTCSVEPSAGWKYDWFRRSTDISEVQVKTNDAENRDMSRKKREPVYYTDHSDPVTIEITFPNKAVVTRQHNWPQIFRGEKITLTCEVQGGEDTEWIYDWRTPRSSTHWTDNKYWTFTASESSSGDYMCRSRLRDDSYSSTEWSEAITLSVSGKQPVLSVSPSWLSPGASVTI